MYLKIESGINIVLHKQCMLLKVLILGFILFYDLNYELSR